MIKSFPHMSFGTSLFPNSSEQIAYAYWQSNGNCVENNHLENCKI